MELYHDIHRPCQASRLEALIADTPDGGSCEIPEGEYFILRRIEIKGRKNLTVNGNGALIVTFFDPCEHYRASSDAFLIEGCENVTLRGFTIDTSSPANVTAYVTGIDVEEKWYTVHVDDAYRMTGRERFLVHYLTDEQGCCTFGAYVHNPDDRPLIVADEIIHMKTEIGCVADYLGANDFKLYLPESVSFLRRLKIGDRVCIRHTVYGLNTFLLRNSSDTLIEDVTVYCAPGMGVLVLPRCRNLTLRRLSFKLHENSPQLLSGNCDGIHMTGLSGHFEMTDCSFDGLGDDALNIHSTAGAVTRVDGNLLRVNYTKKYPDELLSPRFCRSGDRIRLWDAETCTRLGEFTVDSYSGDRMEIRELDGELREGAIMQNLAFCPTVEISRCTAKRLRSRGFIVQAGDTDIHDNYFEDVAGEAIKVGTVFKFYMETGIDGDFKVHKNRFVRCAASGSFKDRRTVAILSRHTGADEKVRGIYRNVLIERNRFEEIDSPLVVVSSAENVTVRDNGEIRLELIGCDNYVKEQNYDESRKT